MKSPGALNAKAGVKTREHGSRRQHRMSREPPGYYFGKRVLLPECLCRWPSLERRAVHFDFSHGAAASTRMLEFLFLRTRLCTTPNYYWSEQNETEKPSNEPPTDQEDRPGDRADQAHRARLIARSIICFGCLSLVKTLFVCVYCFFEKLHSKVVLSIFLLQQYLFVLSCDSSLLSVLNCTVQKNY